MVAELDILNEWIPEQMQPGTIFVLTDAGVVGRARRSLLGRAVLPFVRHAGTDNLPADQRPGSGYSRFGITVQRSFLFAKVEVIVRKPF